MSAQKREELAKDESSVNRFDALHNVKPVH